MSLVFVILAILSIGGGDILNMVVTKIHCIVSVISKPCHANAIAMND